MALEQPPGIFEGPVPPEKERFTASMILAGVGDAIGYKNGSWEFCRSGVRIHQEAEALGGVGSIKVTARDWMISDDTVMTIATAEALLSKWGTPDELYLSMARYYKECMRDMAGRAPGLTCGASAHLLKPNSPQGYVIPFNSRGGGCGAAMRSAPIGLFYWRPEQLPDLIAASIESGRMTHNHPTGFLGSLATALFVSYSLQQKPLREWGAGLLQTVERSMKYLESAGRDIKQHKANWDYFTHSWTDYLKERSILDGKSDPVFPDSYTVADRDAFYKKLSFAGTGGASGHDAPMIAYDALLGCGGSWLELCSRAMLHRGDSDSSGIIAGACWGAMHGFEGVPKGHYEKLEYADKLVALAKKIFSVDSREKTHLF